MLVVSHDRVFLNRIANRIIEIDEHSRQAVVFTGNYDAYAAAKSLRMKQWREDYAQQQDEIKNLRRLLKSKTNTTSQKRNVRTNDGDKFIKHFKDQTADKTLSREAGQLEERLRRIEANPIPQPPRAITLSADYDPATLHGHFPITLSHVRLRYDARVILDDVSLNVEAGERIVITGVNGAGKSTLMKIIAGEAVADSGDVVIASSVRLGYLPQVDAVPMGDDDTLIGLYGRGLSGGYEDHKADLIKSGFFTYEQLSIPARVASAGQRRKAQFALLIAQRANVLLLDEPTNYFSLDLVELIEQALADFDGTIIAISHDRYFLQRFRGRHLNLAAGVLRQSNP